MTDLNGESVAVLPCRQCGGSGDGRLQDDYCLTCGGSGRLTPEESTVCSLCDGQGWYADHEEACFRAGQCVGCGGVQTPCEKCKGTGHNGGSSHTRDAG